MRRGYFWLALWGLVLPDSSVAEEWADSTQSGDSTIVRIEPRPVSVSPT